ncbi:hypothetical protein D3C76_1068930 [compost metagenome]
MMSTAEKLYGESESMKLCLDCEFTHLNQEANWSRYPLCRRWGKSSTLSWWNTYLVEDLALWPSHVANRPTSLIQLFRYLEAD